MSLAEKKPSRFPAVEGFLNTGHLPEAWRLVKEGDYKTMFYDAQNDVYHSVYDFSVIPPNYHLNDDQFVREVQFEAEALLAELVGLSRFEEARQIRWSYKDGMGVMSAPNIGHHTEADVDRWNTNGRNPALLPFTSPQFYRICDVLANMNHVASDIHIDDMVTHPMYGIAFVDLVSRFGGCEDRTNQAESLAELAIEMGFSFDEAHPLLQRVFTDFKYRRPKKERLLWERGVNASRARSIALTFEQMLQSGDTTPLQQYEGKQFAIEQQSSSIFVVGQYEAFWCFHGAVENPDQYFLYKQLPFHWIHQWVATTTDTTTVMHIRIPTSEEERIEAAGQL